MREDEPDDIGAAFQKFAVVTKELAHLMKNLVRSSDLGNGRYRVFLAELEFGGKWEIASTNQYYNELLISKGGSYMFLS